MFIRIVALAMSLVTAGCASQQLIVNRNAWADLCRQGAYGACEETARHDAMIQQERTETAAATAAVLLGAALVAATASSANEPRRYRRGYCRYC